jgi:ABC-2 type transport system ATP-binding protein
MTPGSIIEVEDLVRHFGPIKAVDGITFSVPRGELFGFLGPNGAGKSTTINILCTLLKPTAGRATIDGLDVVKEQHQVRTRIGLVFQDPSLDEQLSAMQNLRFHALIYNIPRNLREERIEHVMKMMELWDRRDNQVKQYSGGMKRRLELARGLLHRPRVLFLDEPTLGLDPQTRVRLWDYIMELKREEGTTIFLTTHYMDEASRADRIAIIDHGKIVGLDTPDKLKSLVGKDVITLTTEDDAAAIREIKERFDLEARPEQDGLCLEVPQGAKFLPKFIRELKTPILSVNLRRPTLDDVFLKLTGRQLRDTDNANSLKEAIHAHGQRSRR